MKKHRTRAIPPLQSQQLHLDSSAKRSPAWAGLRITFGGLLYVLILVLVCLAALNSEANLLFLLCGIGMGVLLYSVVAPVRMVRRIEVERSVPEAVVAGRPFGLVYVVRNRRFWGNAWSLVIGEKAEGSIRPWFPQAFLPVLRARQEERIELTGNCARRGRVALEAIFVTSRFPFGLFACTRRIAAPAELIVYPPVGRLRVDPWRNRRRKSIGAESQQPRDRFGGDEFYGVREYRVGDSPRWIHWRRSAHVGELVVREMAHLRAPQLIVVVDPWPVSASGEHRGSGRATETLVDSAAVEQIISAAATLVCDGLERGYRVGLICRAGDPVVMAPTGGRPARRQMLRALALLRPGKAAPFEEFIPHIRWSEGWQAKCMICATRADNSHAALARFLTRRAETLRFMIAGSSDLDALIEQPPEPELAERPP